MQSFYHGKGFEIGPQKLRSLGFFVVGFNRCMNAHLFLSAKLLKAELTKNMKQEVKQ